MKHLGVNPQNLVLILLLRSLLLLSVAEAVSPPPDGGYPGANTAEGQSALLRLTTGTYNTAVGLWSLKSDSTGSYNTALGAGALVANTGNENTATGFGALLSNSIGFNNTANGVFALANNTTASDNVADGFEALLSNTTGNTNTALGGLALSSNTTGGGNTAEGYSALAGNTTGNLNTALGAGAGGGVATAYNVICVGAGVTGSEVNNSCFIGNIRDVQTQHNDAIPVLIDSSGQLGTISSSHRFKDDIERMDKASEAILRLKPVTFHYKSDKSKRSEFGLVAEEVAGVNPDLVVRDKNGEIYTVRYDAVNAMLLNEFLKEHRKVEEQEREAQEQRITIGELKDAVAKQQEIIVQQQKGMETLTTQLNEQAAQIRKVSTQLEISKTTPQMVSNNQ